MLICVIRVLQISQYVLTLLFHFNNQPQGLEIICQPNSQHFLKLHLGALLHSIVIKRFHIIVILQSCIDVADNTLLIFMLISTSQFTSMFPKSLL
mgnify:CR=1 FL=1